MESPPPTVNESLPPHPGLGRYYRGAKAPFVRKIFDEGAADYDRVERVMAWGSGSSYRRKALLRGGLAAGMKALDVAVGTGLVAREALAITGGDGVVIGVDPSPGMLEQARRNLNIRAVMGRAEELPLARNVFDFLSMGYALRHVCDLNRAFGEFFRVLKPGGRICVMELNRPGGIIRPALLRCYMGAVVPLVARLLTRRTPSQLLWRYYWDTIASCVPPTIVLEAMERAGFVAVKRHAVLGIFSEYTGQKPR